MTTQFYNVTEVGKPLMSDQLEANLMMFLQWGALGIGAFTNVLIPTTSPGGGNPHKLRLADNPNYAKGQVWEGFRNDWVWENNIQYHHQPIAISGVYVNGNFYPTSTTGTYRHHIDYPNGNIVFDQPIPANSVVTAEYSFRNATFHTADAPWWRNLQFDSFRVDSSQFQQKGSGSWSTMSQSRIQLPAIIVDATPNTTRVGKEIGGYQAVVNQDVLIHVLAENRPDMKTWHDIITNQWQQRIEGFDKGKMAASGAFPLNANGSLVSGAKMYPDLIKRPELGGYWWRQIILQNMWSQGPFNVNLPLWYTTIRVTCQVDS